MRFKNNAGLPSIVAVLMINSNAAVQDDSRASLMLIFLDAIKYKRVIMESTAAELGLAIKVSHPPMPMTTQPMMLFWVVVESARRIPVPQISKACNVRLL